MGGIEIPIRDIIARIENEGSTKYVRIWNNQVDNILSGDYEGITFPAAFVECQNGNDFLNIGRGIKSSTMAFRIHLIHEQYDAGTGRMGENLDVFTYKNTIVKLLEYWFPLQCSQLINSYEQQDTQHANLYHYMLDFMCTFIDDVSYLDANLIPVQPTLAIEIAPYIDRIGLQIVVEGDADGLIIADADGNEIEIN